MLFFSSSSVFFLIHLLYLKDKQWHFYFFLIFQVLFSQSALYLKRHKQNFVCSSFLWFFSGSCLLSVFSKALFSPLLLYITFKKPATKFPIILFLLLFLNNLYIRFFSDDSNLSTTFPSSDPRNLGINYRLIGIVISIFNLTIVMSAFAGWSLAWKTEYCYRAIEKVSPATGYSRVPKWPQLGHFLDPKTQWGLSPNTWLLLETWRPPHISSGATNFTHIDKHMKKIQR